MNINPYLIILVYVLILAAILLFFATSPADKWDKRPIVTRKPEQSLVLIFGATGKKGQAILEELSGQDYFVVAASRRNKRWKELPEQLIRDIPWIRCDVRINADVESVFDNIKEWYGSIDYVINCAVIDKQDQYLQHILPSRRQSDNIITTLPGAYSDSGKRYHLHKKGAPGSEHSLFTNFIGMINVAYYAYHYHVEKLIIPKSSNPLINALANQLITEGEQTDFRPFPIEPKNIGKPGKVTSCLYRDSIFTK